MIVDTTAGWYQEYLAVQQAIRAGLNSTYVPLLQRMTKEQIIQLYESDPLFKEAVLLTIDMNRIAKRMGFEL